MRKTFLAWLLGAFALTGTTATAQTSASAIESNKQTLYSSDNHKSTPYRIPAIAKTSTGRLIAVSDYRHNLDDIGRDKHGTGKMRIDLVARTSDDNGATWSEPVDIADAIYVGVSTDTGCFRYSNTKDHTFATAALCAKAGARVYELNQELFETNTLGRLRMQAWIVDHMKMLRGGEMAIVAIPKAVEESIGVTDAELGNLSSYARSIEGVCLAATLRQGKYGETKVSIRAVPGWDATKVTVVFGGGGHKGAAGGAIKLPLGEAARAVEKVMLEV